MGRAQWETKTLVPYQVHLTLGWQNTSMGRFKAAIGLNSSYQSPPMMWAVNQHPGGHDEHDRELFPPFPIRHFPLLVQNLLTMRLLVWRVQWTVRNGAYSERSVNNCNRFMYLSLMLILMYFSNVLFSVVKQWKTFNRHSKYPNNIIFFWLLPTERMYTHFHWENCYANVFIHRPLSV